MEVAFSQTTAAGLEVFIVDVETNISLHIPDCTNVDIALFAPPFQNDLIQS